MDAKTLQDRLRAEKAYTPAAKAWFKKIERAKKLAPAVIGKYQTALDALHRVEEIAMRMEELLLADTFALDQHAENSISADPDASLRISAGSVSQIPIGTDRVTKNSKEMASLAKELKKYRNRFDHAFVIAPEDEQFHLIYDTIIRLGASYSGADTEQLILQSEVENLLDLIHEHLQRQQPDAFALCYYYMEKSEKALEKLPPQERVAKVERICRKEFCAAMQQLLCEALAMSEEEAAEQVKELLSVSYDPQGRK